MQTIVGCLPIEMSTISGRSSTLFFARTHSSLGRARGKVSTFHQQNQAHEGAPTGGGHPQGVPRHERYVNEPYKGRQGVPLQARFWLAAATLVAPHCWDYGAWLVRHVFGGGRCGGNPPAQGRAEGPTAQMDVRPLRRLRSVTFDGANACPEPPEGVFARRRPTSKFGG